MRYYRITVTPQQGSFAGIPLTFTTIDSVTPYGNYSALQVELDIMQAFLHQPQQLGLVRIKGVVYSDISQASDYNGARIQVWVGMSLGLPLANASQQGLILDGTVFQAFGNWQGTNVSLDLVVGPSSFANNNENPANLSWTWYKDTTLQESINQTLSNAYKDIKITGIISPNLKAIQTQTNIFTNLTSFAQNIKGISKSYKIQENYNGVNMVATNNGVFLDDGTVSSTNFSLVNYEDLIGNITYISAAQIQAKIVMRGNLQLLNYIQFPKGSPVATVDTKNPLNFYRNEIPFKGIYQISQIHHMGNSRQADANSWVTVLNCFIPNESDIPYSIRTPIADVGIY